MDPQLLVEITAERRLKEISEEVTTKLQAAIESPHTVPLLHSGEVAPHAGMT